MATQSRIFPSLLYSSASIYTEYLLGLVVSIVIARSLGPENFGIYALVIWISGLSITLINAGISIVAIKFTSELSGSGMTAALPQIERYLVRIQLTKAVILALVLSLIAILMPSLVVGKDEEILIWVIIPAILFKSFYMFQAAIIKGRQDFRSLARIALITAPLNILFVTIAHYASPTILGYLIAFLFTSIVYFMASTSSLKLIRAAPRFQEENSLDAELKSRVNKMLGYTSLIILFAYLVYGQSELLFLKHLRHASDLAFFSVGFVLARSAAALIPGVYNNILLPRISYAVGQDKENVSATLLTASRHMLLLGLLCAVPLAIFAKDIVLFLYGEAYHDAYIPLIFFSLVTIFTGVRDTANAFLVSMDQQPLILRIVFILFCVTMALDYFLILEFGLLGAVAAYAALEVMATAVVSFYAYRLLGQWPDFNQSVRALGAAVATALIAYGLGSILTFHGGFIIGGALCPVVFVGCLVLFDAFDDDDYKAARPLFQGRTDRISRALTDAINVRLAANHPVRKQD